MQSKEEVNCWFGGMAVPSWKSSDKDICLNDPSD